MAKILTGFADLFADPDWYLHRIDPVEDRATFVRTDQQSLTSTLFLDGRTPFAAGKEEYVPLGELAAATAETPQRFVMHMSFCGSTQLAHLIDASGAAVVLKEPQALVDLSDWQRAMVEQRVSDDRFETCLTAASGLLSRQWDAAPPTVLKPSNWANNLLPALAGSSGRRILLIRIDRRSFLHAVFRGGRDRMAYTARAAAHLAGATGQSRLIEAAVSSVADPLDRMARIALVGHAVQERLFAVAIERASGRCGLIDYSDIVENPEAALRTAATILELTPSVERIADAIGRRANVDSKNPDQGFRASDQQQEDREVETHHSQRFDRAMSWASESLPGVR
jgi:hypothetical protein